MNYHSIVEETGTSMNVGRWCRHSPAEHNTVNSHRSSYPWPWLLEKGERRLLISAFFPLLKSLVFEDMIVCSGLQLENVLQVSLSTPIICALTISAEGDSKFGFLCSGPKRSQTGRKAGVFHLRIIHILGWLEREHKHEVSTWNKWLVVIMIAGQYDC